MSFEALILKRAESKLESYRKEGERQKRLRVEYQDYQHRIKRLYKEASYWHGTGRYHHMYSGGSRYGKVRAEAHFDVLESIIQGGGLIPHADPWIPSGGKTVSLGTARMHSRLFACAHRYETDTLLYELGSMKFWIRLYGALLLSWLSTNFDSAAVLFRALSRPSSLRDVQSWASAVRSSKNGSLITFRNLLLGINLGSDIAGNYPLLFGISKENLEVIDTLPLTHRVEVRTLSLVGLSSFTHIEVPSSRVKETESFLRNRNINLEVIPLEFGDMYLGSVPLRQLAYTD